MAALRRKLFVISLPLRAHERALLFIPSNCCATVTLDTVQSQPAPEQADIGQDWFPDAFHHV